MAVGRVERQIRFYAWENIPDRPEFDLTAAGAAIANLTDENWRLIATDMTTAGLIDVQPQGVAPLCMRFFRLREGDDVPHKMDVQRATTPIEVAEGEAITDWTHVVIWPDGYAAHDPHRDAPTLTRLESYLRQRANQRVAFIPLFDRDLLDRLRGLDDLTSVELRISKADQLQEADDQNLGLFGGIFNMARASESATLQTKISVGRDRKRHLSDDVKGDIIRVAETASEFLDQLVVKGKDGNRTVRIDLMNQRIEILRSVPRATPRVRQPAAQAMYDAIIDTRRELDRNGVLANAARGHLR